MKLKFKKLHKQVKSPVFGSAGAACFDVHAVIAEDYETIGSLGSAMISTGLAFEVPEGHVLKMYSRSGHGAKHGLRMSNCVGIIDSDYRGEVKVPVHCDSIEGYTIKNGERIAQMMLVEIPSVDLEEVEKLSETERGGDGFGSTGKA